MSGLLFLTADDFEIINDNSNKILVNKIPGFSLILFYSTYCEHCHNILEVIKSLPGTITSFQFGIINVSLNKQTIIDARDTITPLQYVPYIILYYNGRPYMRYDGEHNLESINKFAYEVATSIQLKVEQYQNDEEGQIMEHYEIPEYCIARPTKGGTQENICYLNFSEAYYS